MGDGAVAFHTGAPSPEARKGKGRSAPGKKRKGMVAADGWGQGVVREGKEQRAWAKRVRAVQRRRAVKGRSGAGRANGAPAGPRGRVVRSRPAWDGPRGRKKGRGGGCWAERGRGKSGPKGEMRWTGPPAVGQVEQAGLNSEEKKIFK